MTKSGEKKEYLTLGDQLQIEKSFNEKLLNPESTDLEKNIGLSNEIIEKITNFCDSLDGKLTTAINWKSRESVFQFFSNLNRLFKTISQGIVLTSGREDSMSQANRWKELVEKFFVLYISLLEEAGKHIEEDDAVLGVPIIAENEVEDLKFILEDDMVQEIFSTNHLILDLIKKSSTSSTLNEILSNY